MELTLFEHCQRRRMTRRLAVYLFITAGFYAAVCTPVYLIAVSDVLIQDTAFPMVWDCLMMLVNYGFYWISFSFVAYAALRFRISKCMPLLSLYAGMVVFRYGANIIAGFLVNGFPTVNSFLSDTFPYFLIDIILDWVQMAVVVFILYWIDKNSPHRRAEQRGALLLSNMPIVGLLNFQNPVMRAALWSGIVPAAVQLLSRVRYDIAVGAPVNAVDLLWMIVYYLSDILMALVGYFLMVLLLNRLFLKEEKARRQDEENALL